jgi:hypothetical protein
VAFSADDFAAWLTGLLAATGGQKLSTFVLGDDQERALRQAATTAVKLTAAELRPDDDDQAEYLARVISQVFSAPMPGAAVAGRTTMLVAIRAGIIGQLALLDDPSLAGSGRSSAEMVDLPGAAVAEKLTDNLLQEIVSRASRGGPLVPLAVQLNHDVTYLQGQRIEAMLARLESGRTGVAKWRVSAAGLSVVAAAAIGLMTALVTAHSSLGLWVALAVLVKRSRGERLTDDDFAKERHLRARLEPWSASAARGRAASRWRQPGASSRSSISCRRRASNRAISPRRTFGTPWSPMQVSRPCGQVCGVARA